MVRGPGARRRGAAAAPPRARVGHDTSTPARFLAIGHVARDEFPDGAHRLGGTALYAAATAARLGVPAALVTRVGPNEKGELSRTCERFGIDLRALDALVTTTFAFRWDEQGHRILRLKARARAIALGDIPPDLRAADAIVFGTIARELADTLLAGETAPVTVLAAQGLLRAWDADGTVRPRPWDDAMPGVGQVSAVVVSEDDVAGDAESARCSSAAGRVVLTLAERGCRLYERGDPVADLPAYPPERMVDTTGAGDAFAAGLAIALAEGRAVVNACRFANAVASFALEGPGIEPLASRERVEARLARQPGDARAALP